MIKQNKLVFDKPIQILDGNDITLGKSIGTRLGNGTDQKLGFLGTTPRVRAPLGVLVQPTGGATVDSEARASISDVISLLGNQSGFGFAETTF